jgi:hypothetical protein
MAVETNRLRGTCAVLTGVSGAGIMLNQVVRRDRQTLRDGNSAELSTSWFDASVAADAPRLLGGEEPGPLVRRMGRAAPSLVPDRSDEIARHIRSDGGRR